MDLAGHLLLALAALLALCRVLGQLAVRLGQPPVMGELVAGIVLGPSVLGAVAHGWEQAVFPVALLPVISAIASLGVTLFMLDVGLNFEFPAIDRRGWRIPVLSACNVIVPFGAGCALAGALWSFHGAQASRLAFVLFMGVAMSVTAFPVLARIIEETGLTGTPLARRVLAVTAAGDVTAWILLAVATAVASGHSPWDALRVFGGLLAVTIAWLLLGRRVLALVGTNVGTVVITALLLGGLTDWIGAHAIFGGFLAGAVVRPSDAQIVSARLSGTVRTLLLPVFFVSTGLSTALGSLGIGDVWVIVACLVVATAGKLGAGTFGARITGSPWREAAATGALLNTRGLTELVVLSVGLQSGVLSGRLFSALVVVAVITTAMTRPLLTLIGVDAGVSPGTDRSGAGAVLMRHHTAADIVVPRQPGKRVVDLADQRLQTPSKRTP